MKRGTLLRLLAALLTAALLPLPAVAENDGVLTVEAETGLLLGAARLSADGTRVEGLATPDVDGVTVTLTVPTAGFYDVVVRSASADNGSKTNYVDIDGARAGEIVTTGRALMDATLERIYLEAGEHQVSVIGYWCWISIDRVSLIPSQPLPGDLFDVSPTLVNPDASENARRLMAYLCDSYGHVVLSGQYSDGGAFGNENACIAKASGGKYPAVLGLDLIEYSPSRASHHQPGELQTVEQAIEYWEMGGIVTLCWHWNVPEKYNATGVWWDGFYTEKVSIDLAKIMNGENPEGYDLLMADIDAIAEELTRLRDAGVPVLWRPLHEAAGGWFWWGASGPEAYLALYRAMYDRLVNVHGLNNLIWVWNGQDAAWYPGDEYVDIIGEDIYPGERAYGSQSQRFLQASRYTDARKLIVLSENGVIPDPDLLFRDGTPWGFFCTWQGEFIEQSDTSDDMSERYTEKSMVHKAFNSDLVITRDELPDLKNYPLPN